MGDNRAPMAVSAYPHCKWGKKNPQLSPLHLQAAQTAWMHMEKLFEAFFSLFFSFFFSSISRL